MRIGTILRQLAFSTNTSLAANAVYTSPTIDAINYKNATISGISDQAGGWVTQYSDDGITFYSTTSTATVAITFFNTNITIAKRYFRIVYTNGATPQGSFNASGYLAPL